MLTPWRVLDPGTVVVEGERIAAVLEGPAPDLGEAEQIHAAGFLVVPGFVDIHIHGAAGHDTMDATPEALEGMARFLARHGVTSFLPTTVAAKTEDILAAVANVAACQNRDLGGARVLGIHLEGPYLNPHWRGGSRWSTSALRLLGSTSSSSPGATSGSSLWPQKCRRTGP